MAFILIVTKTGSEQRIAWLTFTSKRVLTFQNLSYVLQITHGAAAFFTLPNAYGASTRRTTTTVLIIKHVAYICLAFSKFRRCGLTLIFVRNLLRRRCRKTPFSKCTTTPNHMSIEHTTILLEPSYKWSTNLLDYVANKQQATSQ